MTDDEGDLAEVSPEDELVDETDEDGRQAPPVGQSGLVYGLGFIGALVWFWKQADGPEEHVLGLLKALVWPAFLVYGAFRALNGATGEPLRTLGAPDGE